MKDRDLATLVDLAVRVRAHCHVGPWSNEMDVRARADHDAFRAGTLGRDDQNVFEVSKVYRWVASWNRREQLVAVELGKALGTVGVERSMLPEDIP